MGNAEYLREWKKRNPDKVRSYREKEKKYIARSPTHCPKGHQYSAENTLYSNGGRWGKPRKQCLACKKAYLRFLRPGDDKRDAYSRFYRAVNYDLTPESYLHMMQSQSNNCAMCGRSFVQNELRNMQPVVDHDHVTGRVRGIIHAKCNTALGCLEDNPDFCDKASTYLRTALFHGKRMMRKS